MQDKTQINTFIEMAGRAKEGGSLNWLLVMPKITLFDDQQYSFPVGIAYVSSALKTTGRKVFTLNLNYKKESTYALLSEAIRSHSIDVIACGGISVQYRILKEIIDAAKEIKPDIIAIVGGGLITSEPVAAMQALEIADYGIVGEGEITICELASKLEAGLRGIDGGSEQSVADGEQSITDGELSTVAGIVYRGADKQWTVTKPRGEIGNLDIIPWPDYDGFEYEQMLKKTPIDILTGKNKNEAIGILFYSRSCPYNCTFCFHSSGRKYRTRTLDGFFQEFDHLMKKYSFDNFFLADEYFISNLNFVKEFCKRIKQYNIRWTCSGRVDNITKELLETLKDSGCFQIQFGVESACDKILKSMRKNITRAQIENAFSLCWEAGIAASGNLIFGDLEETVETAMETINWYKAHPKWSLAMHWIIAYPGSFVYKTARERGIISDAAEFIRAGCPEVNFSKMTYDERRRIAFIIDTAQSVSHDKLRDAKIMPGSTGKITVTGKCPYCGKTAAYNNIDPIRPVKLETCPQCSHTLRLYCVDYLCADTVRSNLEEMAQAGKTAIWPVLVGLDGLLERVATFQTDNFYLVDSSPFKKGLEISGKIVHSPDIIAQYGIDTVILTTTTSVGAEIAGIINKDYPNVREIVNIGELFFPMIN